MPTKGRKRGAIPALPGSERAKAFGCRCDGSTDENGCHWINAVCWIHAEPRSPHFIALTSTFVENDHVA